MGSDFSKPFTADISIKESDEYPGLQRVSFHGPSYSDLFIWTGSDLATGVAAAISSLLECRDRHNAEHEKIKARLAQEQNKREEFGENTDPAAESGPNYQSAPLRAVSDDVPF